jgi:hypothetical protein
MVDNSLASVLSQINRIAGQTFQSPHVKAGGFYRERESESAYSIYTGVILDSIPFIHCYRVILNNLNVVIVATAATVSGLNRGSVKSYHGYPPGTPVVVVWGKQAPYGIILGAIPLPARTAKDHTCDRIGLGPTAFDTILKAYFDDVTAPQALNDHANSLQVFDVSRPMDCVSGLDTGFIADTGLGLHIDPFMIYFRVDETTGIYAFYSDMLLRVSAVNFEEFTSVGTRRYYHDEYELVGIEENYVYPHERLGLVYGPAGASGISDESQLLNVANKIRPYAREVIYKGYLGNVRLHLVQGLLAKVAPANFDENFAVNQVPVGLYLHHIAADGGAIMMSARHLVIGKCNIFPAPKPMYDQWSTSGDSINYGTHAFSNRIPFTDQNSIIIPWHTNNISQNATIGWTSPPQYTALFSHNRLTALAWWTYYEPFIPFVDRVDWQIPEINNLELITIGKGPDNPRSTVYTDFNHPYSNYYNTQAFLAFLDDGNIMMLDGNMCEISTCDGNLLISAPRDINIIAGGRINIVSKDTLTLGSIKQVNVESKKNLNLFSKDGTIVHNGLRVTGLSTFYDKVRLFGNPPVVMDNYYKSKNSCEYVDACQELASDIMNLRHYIDDNDPNTVSIDTVASITEAITGIYPPIAEAAVPICVANVTAGAYEYITYATNLSNKKERAVLSPVWMKSDNYSCMYNPNVSEYNVFRTEQSTSSGSGSGSGGSSSSSQCTLPTYAYLKSPIEALVAYSSETLDFLEQIGLHPDEMYSWMNNGEHPITSWMAAPLQVIMEQIDPEDL